MNESFESHSKTYPQVYKLVSEDGFYRRFGKRIGKRKNFGSASYQKIYNDISKLLERAMRFELTTFTLAR